MIATQDAAGAATSYEYDAAGRVIASTDANGNRLTYAYDANGNERSVTDSAGRAVSYERDALGRTVQTTLPGGGTISYAYDALGRVTQLTDALGGVSALSYNAAGNPLSVTNANGASIGYGYDALGNVTTQTAPKGSEWSTYYDHLSNVILTKDPTGAQTMYVYDAAGNRIKEEGPAGTTVYLYDEADRLQSTEGARVSAYTWDADGNLIAQKDGDAAYEYLYDTESRLLAVREGGSLLMSVLYDGLDNRAYGLEYKMIDRHLNQFPHLPGYWNNGQWNCIPEEPAGPKNGRQAAQADSAPEETAEEQGLWAAVMEWVSEIFGGENAGEEAGIDTQSKEKAAKGKGKDDGYTNNGGADNDHGGNGNTNNGNGKPGNNGNGNGNGGSEETAGPISDWARKKLTKLGFTEMDLATLERLGVTDADARRIVETAGVPNTGNGPTHFIPTYDLMFYVNDINRENVEVLAMVLQNAEMASAGTAVLYYCPVFRHRQTKSQKDT